MTDHETGEERPNTTRKRDGGSPSRLTPHSQRELEEPPAAAISGDETTEEER